jgi:acid phosphatase (class A)
VAGPRLHQRSGWENKTTTKIMKITCYRRTFLNVALAGALALSLLAGCTTQNTANSSARSQLGAIPEFRPELKLGALQGYLAATNLPDSLALIPPPPAPGSAAYAMDMEVAQNTFALRNTPRFALAASDFELNVPHFIEVFSCSLGTHITKENAPYLHTLLSRAFTDLAMSTYAAKNFYKRERPFQVNGQPLAVPEARNFLEHDPSYPSGHTALGWGFALILGEIAPDRDDQIFARGRAFGESRIVCNHHWYSDVVWGRFMGAATVARLHADPTFEADLAAAKVEYAALRAKGVPPIGDCNAEAAALALGYQASPVTAIDILLEPDATMLQKCSADNARLLGVYAQGFALDAAHTPHITMLQCFVRTADLPQLYAAEEKVLAAANVTQMKLEAFKRYYIPAGGTGVAGICARRTPEILKLQADIIAAASPFNQRAGAIGAFTAPHDNPVLDNFLVKYVSTFEQIGAGEKFNPHVSTGTAPAADLDKLLAEPFENFTFSPAGAAVYQLGPFGTAAKQLKQFDLKP